MPVVALSARTGEGLDALMAAVIEAHAVWNRRVPTAALNRFLAQAAAAHPPPAVRGRRLRLDYITQPKARPPTFVLFSSRAQELPEAYRRYLINALREAFALPGTPIRLTLRAQGQSLCGPEAPLMEKPVDELNAKPGAPWRRAAFVFIFATILLDMLAIGIIIPVLPKLVVDFVGGDTEDAATIFGLFGTAWALMQFVFSPIQGALSDRFGRRAVILISNFGVGLDYVLMALAPSLAGCSSAG